MAIPKQLKTKTTRQSINALRNSRKVFAKDLQAAYLDLDESGRKLLMSLVKNRRRELLNLFAETKANSLYNQISVLDKFMYLFTKNEVYNMNRHFTIQGDYVVGTVCCN